jgi:prephenate dehydrogenase
MIVEQRRTLCIVGMGLIGGSIAAALKTRVPQRWRVLGVDRRRGCLRYAQERGFLDQACDSLGEGVADADLVVLAVPVSAIREQLAALAALVRPGQIVSDVGSTKTGILADAALHLPEGVAFVGAHPVAGLEHSGVENAVPGLFDARPCVLTPGGSAGDAAVATVAALWREVGAEVLYLDAHTHDRVFAFLSHLPHMVAYALVDTASTACNPQERTLAGGDFHDFTRVARNSPAVWRDVCLENRDVLLQALDSFAAALQGMRTRIAEGNADELLHHFQRCVQAKDEMWIP